MVLVPLLALVFLRSFFCSLALLILVLFLISAIPFALRTWRKDPAVGLLFPLLLFRRALALGLGMAKGSWDAAFRGEVMS